MKTFIALLFALGAWSALAQPSLTSSIPANGESAFSTVSHLYLYFDEDVTTGSGDFYLRYYDNDAVFKTFSAVDLVNPVGVKYVYISYEIMQLPNNTLFYLDLPAGVIKSADGSTNFPGIGKNDLHFTTTVDDPTGPQVQSLSPANGATGVTKDQVFTITFDEPIQPWHYTVTAGSQVLLQKSDNTTLRTYYVNLNDVDNGRIEFSGNTIMFKSTPFSGGLVMEPSTTYNFYFAPTSCRNKDGVSSNTSTADTFWSFTTGVRPSEESRYPAHQATDVELSAEIMIDFDMNISQIVTAGQTVTFYKNNVLQKVYTFLDDEVRIEGDKFYFKPAVDLEENTTYSLALGNLQATDSHFQITNVSKDNWSFTTTGPSSPPTDIALSGTTVPSGSASGAIIGTISGTDPDDDIISYELVYDAGSGTLYDDFYTDGTTLYSGYNGFDINTKASYDITIKAIDSKGNTYEEDFVITVTSEDHNAPIITAFNPATGSTGVSVNLGEVVISFDEAVKLSGDPGTGGTNYYLELRNMSGNVVLKQFDVATEGVFDENTLTLQNIPELSPNTEYAIRYWTYTKTPILDLAGNALESFNNFTDWNFVTESLSVTWSGTAWSNATGPTANSEVIIAGDYTVSENGLFVCNALVINSGTSLLVDGENTLVVNGAISNNGTFTVESGASLITYSGKAITGNLINIKRTTRYADGRYSFVGTPVGLSIYNTGSSIGNPTYSYTETVAYGSNAGLDRWEKVTSAYLSPGKGYAQAFKQELTFSGYPNRGDINVGGTYTEDVNDDLEGWNLVANPYAAAISVQQFLDENSNLLGAVYLWDDNNSGSARGTNADYIVANSIAAISGGQTANQSRYEGYVASAQGFFVKVNDASKTNIAFKENMRVSGHNADDHFYRKTENEIPYLRLNFTDQEGLFKQTIIGWVSGVNDQELNHKYDAPMFSADLPYGIYTVKSDQNLAIQGVSPQCERVILGLNIAEPGTYALSADFANAQGYSFILWDKQTDQLADLSAGAYTFVTTQTGKLKERFELRASSNILSAEKTQPVQVWVREKQLVLKADQPAHFQLFNLSGQQIWHGQVGQETEINLSQWPTGVYLLTNGTFIHKFVLK